MNYVYQQALNKCAEIQKLIEQDVNSRYNQDNPPEPYSHLFIDDKENWRCYIFGVIGGILLQSPKHRNGFVSMTYIDEDDGHWFISESPIDTCDAEWVEDNTVNGAFNLASNTETRAKFEQVRIPMFNEKGRAMDARMFANQLRKHLREQSIECKVMNKGLGEAVLVIGEK